jgi:hypothetical protein
MKKLCYISSPFTEGDQLKNARDAISAVIQRLDNEEIIPLSPLTMGVAIQIFYPLSHQEWMQYDLDLLSKCDCMIVIGDAGMVARSKGVQAEIAFAVEHNIPFEYDFYNYDEAYKNARGTK